MQKPEIETEMNKFDHIFKTIQEQSVKTKEELDYTDLSKLVDLKKDIKKLSVQTGEDLDNKDFAVECLNTLLQKTLLQLSFSETPSKLSQEALDKAQVNLESKLDQLYKIIGNRQTISEEELEQLEKNLFKSYGQIVLNKIPDGPILLNVALIENAVKTIKDLELVK